MVLVCWLWLQNSAIKWKSYAPTLVALGNKVGTRSLINFIRLFNQIEIKFWEYSFLQALRRRHFDKIFEALQVLSFWKGVFNQKKFWIMFLSSDPMRLIWPLRISLIGRQDTMFFPLCMNFFLKTGTSDLQNQRDSRRSFWSSERRIRSRIATGENREGDGTQVVDRGRYPCWFDFILR